MNDLLNYSFIDSYLEWKCSLSTSNYDVNPNLFQIEYSFYSKNNPRKRKAPTDEFSELQEFHDQLHKVLNDFRNKLKLKTGYLQINNDVDHKNKNIDAVVISKQYLENNKLFETCYELSNTKQLTLSDTKLKYFHNFIENSANNWETIDVFERQYLLPPNSGFIMSDIKFANKLIRNIDRKFDLIVIDPPVKNKSVKQFNAYGFLEEIDLLELPIRHVVKENSIVAVWCTNSAKCMESVESTLFRAWGVKLKAVCTWLKVTKSGDPVLDLNDRFRRPYEKLFLGRISFKDSIKPSDRDLLSDLDDHVILSVPCSLHSAKPNLQNFLSEYLPDKPQCLELFARNLYPGWISWGNEPLKFLSKDLLVPKLSDNTETL